MRIAHWRRKVFNIGGQTLVPKGLLEVGGGALEDGGVRAQVIFKITGKGLPTTMLSPPPPQRDIIDVFPAFLLRL